jgi:hypothetical protein
MRMKRSLILLSCCIVIFRISHLDPIWEASYDRQFFDFSSGDEDEAFDTTDDDKPPSTP